MATARQSAKIAIRVFRVTCHFAFLCYLKAVVQVTIFCAASRKPAAAE